MDAGGLWTDTGVERTYTLDDIDIRLDKRVVSISSFLFHPADPHKGWTKEDVRTTYKDGETRGGQTDIDLDLDKQIIYKD